LGQYVFAWKVIAYGYGFRCAAIRAGCGHGEPNYEIGYAEHYSRSHDSVIRVFDQAANVIETHEHARE